jgi:hypothetical protein
MDLIDEWKALLVDLRLTTYKRSMLLDLSNKLLVLSNFFKILWVSASVPPVKAQVVLMPLATTATLNS